MPTKRKHKRKNNKKKVGGIFFLPALGGIPSILASYGAVGVPLAGALSGLTYGIRKAVRRK
jgi:hypothetical protein